MSASLTFRYCRRHVYERVHVANDSYKCHSSRAPWQPLGELVTNKVRSWHDGINSCQLSCETQADDKNSLNGHVSGDHGNCRCFLSYQATRSDSCVHPGPRVCIGRGTSSLCGLGRSPGERTQHMSIQLCKFASLEHPELKPIAYTVPTFTRVVCSDIYGLLL